MKELSAKDTIKYLHTIRDLEKSLYMQDSYLEELSRRFFAVRNPIYKNEMILYNSRRQEELLANEYNHALDYYNETENVLNKFYNADVIYPKYRDLVAVTMFCEYFESGRCTTLTGHKGAYNIFEDEARMNLILVKLDDIITRLDRIESNQYMLAQLISSCRNNIQRLTGIAEKQLSMLHEIKESQEASEYYYRITAENTNATKWLVYLNSVK